MSLRVKLILEALDRATAPIKGVRRAVQSLTLPAQKLQKLFQPSEQTRALMEQLRGFRTGALWLTAMAGASLYALKRFTDLGDAAVNTAKRVGMTVQAVQRLNFAAEQNGSNAGEMADGLKFLNRNAVNAATGSQEAAIWFRRAGISVKDAHGKLKPTEQLLAELADRFAKIPDGPKKTALAMGLLGRSGESLIPTLNLGRKGLEEMARRAEWLGIVLDKDTAQSLDDLGDNIEDVGRAGRGIFIAALKPLLPALNDIARATTSWLVANRALIAGKITEFAKALGEILPVVWQGISLVASGIGWFVGAVNRIVQATVGWKAVLIGVAAVLAGKLAIALLATPVGWFAAAIVALVALADLVIRHWGPIKEFFAGLWAGIVEVFNTAVATIGDIVRFLVNTVLWPFVQMLKLVNALMPESMKGTALGRGVSGAVNWLDQPAQSPFGRRVGQTMQQVGGTIRIQFDDNGRPRVREVRQENEAVDFEVEGYATVGGA